jgi:hypothetical protein
VVLGEDSDARDVRAIRASTGAREASRCLAWVPHLTGPELWQHGKFLTKISSFFDYIHSYQSILCLTERCAYRGVWHGKARKCGCGIDANPAAPAVYERRIEAIRRYRRGVNFCGDDAALPPCIPSSSSSSTSTARSYQVSSSSTRPPYSIALSALTYSPSPAYMPRSSIFFAVELHLLLFILVCMTCCVVMC